jgi:hypothetical protein
MFYRTFPPPAPLALASLFYFTRHGALFALKVPFLFRSARITAWQELIIDALSFRLKPVQEP